MNLFLNFLYTTKTSLFIIQKNYLISYKQKNTCLVIYIQKFFLFLIYTKNKKISTCYIHRKYKILHTKN